MDSSQSHADGAGGDLTGADRCWPCTVANSVVGLVVAWLPLAVALVNPAPAVLAGAVVWGALVTGVTGYRLVTRGYLPLAEPVAKVTGLHERIGPGAEEGGDAEREPP
jgi:hypothetical protein